MRTVTFEFPDDNKARAFFERCTAEGYSASRSHRVVDVTPPTLGDHDVIVMAAAYLGATDQRTETVTGSFRDEPLYLLTIGADEITGADTMLTTLAEFLAANPDEMRNASSWSLAPGAVTHGGGGASPRWRLERTAYVGRKA